METAFHPVENSRDEERDPRETTARSAKEVNRRTTSDHQRDESRIRPIENAECGRRSSSSKEIEKSTTEKEASSLVPQLLTSVEKPSIKEMPRIAGWSVGNKTASRGKPTAVDLWMKARGGG